jgi:hypothetical protein
MKTPREKQLFRQFVEASATPNGPGFIASTEAGIASAEAGDDYAGGGALAKPYKDMFDAEQAAKVALKQKIMTAASSLRQAHKESLSALNAKIGPLEDQLVDIGAAYYALEAWALRRAPETNEGVAGPAQDSAPRVWSVTFPE